MINLKLFFSFQNLTLKYCKKANILNTNLTNLIDYNENFLANDERHNIVKLIQYFANKIKNQDADQVDKKLLEMIEPEIIKTIGFIE